MKARGFFTLALRVCFIAALLLGVATPTPAQIPGGGGPEILPALKLRVLVPETSEGPVVPGTATLAGMFELFRDGATNEELHACLNIGGTALNGVDYTNIPNWFIVPAGVRSVPIPVQPIDDTLIEGTETVELKLVYPPLASPLPINYVIGSPSNGVVRIFDNDPPPVTPAVVTIVASDPEAAEPGVATVINDGEFKISRTGPTDFALPVLLRIVGTASNGVDYATLSKTVVIPIGEASTRVRVTALFDLLLEPTETVVLQLETPVCIAIYPPPRECYEVGIPAEAVVKIVDNRLSPRPVVRIEARDPEATEIPEVPPWLDQPQRVDPAVFVVTRTGGDTNSPLEVFYSVSGTASNGVDYIRLPGMVTIPNGREAAAIEVVPIDDTAVEGTETIVLRILPPSCTNTDPPPGGCYQVGVPSEALAKLLDNDLPPTNRPPEVKLTKPLDGQTFVLPVNVPLRADAVDADGYVPHIKFYADEIKIGEETRMFLIAPPPGQHHIFEFAWTNPPVGRHVLRAKAQDDDGAFGWSAPVTIWVVKTNEPPTTNRPTVVTITAPDPVASEGTNCMRWPDWPIVAGADFRGTNTALFVIRRSGPTNDPLKVFYHIGGTASNGVDYAELPGWVTIGAGRRAAEFKVVPVDDSLPERLETVVLSLRVPPDATANVPPYVLGCPNRAAAVIVDNDQPRPLTSILPDRCFHIMRPGNNGGWYRIEWTTDLVHWTVLGTNQVVEGALHFVDPDADDSVQRFYRAVPAPAPAPE